MDSRASSFSNTTQPKQQQLSQTPPSRTTLSKSKQLSSRRKMDDGISLGSLDDSQHTAGLNSSSHERSNNNNNNNNNNSKNNLNKRNSKKFKDSNNNNNNPNNNNPERRLSDGTAAVGLVPVKDETIAVEKLKLVIMTVLCVSTVGISLALVFYSRQLEYNQFESQFESDGLKIAQELGNKFNLMIGALDMYIESTTTFASVSNNNNNNNDNGNGNDMAWPFVTTPNTADRISRILRRTNSFSLQQYPIVQNTDRMEWEQYSVTHDDWVQEGIDFLRYHEDDDTIFAGEIIEDYETIDYIFDNNGLPADASDPFYLPLWQHSPVVPVIHPPYNYDGKSLPTLIPSFEVIQQGHAVLSSVFNMELLLQDDDMATSTSTTTSSKDEAQKQKEWAQAHFGDTRDVSDPFSKLYYPIWSLSGNNNPSKNTTTTTTTVGVLTLAFFWSDLFKNVLPTGDKSIYAVIHNGCNDEFTLLVDGPSVKFLGVGNRHDTKYTHMEEILPVANLSRHAVEDLIGYPLADGVCSYMISLFPHKSYKKSFHTNNAIIFSIASFCILAFTGVLFLLYDSMVELRQGVLMSEALRSKAIVSSLFPENVRDRIFDSESALYEPPKTRLKSFLQHSSRSLLADEEEKQQDAGDKSRQIADLFPETTVLFADIAGFTAWSSVREPSHVFTLLEAIYGAFDKIAARRGVFKVETIGDAYVAVAGLPEPRDDHAVVMVKFARDCRSKCVEITRNLEVSLGPGTGDLRYRFGLHSGPVTAGVLRGQKSRFQLFGDTVNTASRMESTGIAHGIHISEATAFLLMDAGKSSWIRKRHDKVEAKGKGLMQTYWVDFKNDTTKDMEGSGALCEDASTTTALSLNPVNLRSEYEDKIMRLINWNTDVLAKQICHIVSRRRVSSVEEDGEHPVLTIRKDGATAIDEVKEIIELPDFDREAMDREEDDPITQLPEHIVSQLKKCVTMIASEYLDNPFHNFEHASHVAMSTAKLLSRIVAPDKVYVDGVAFDRGTFAWSIHDHTFGIASDPLTQFACIFAAIIHDVGHRGIPNVQLAKEDPTLAHKYRTKCVAEQHSVDIAWEIFMDDEFRDLRKAICHTSKELHRFRELVVNCVIATDIFDPDLKKLRNARWEKAFSSEEQIEEPNKDRVNRKATIVIEHLLQASDVAHTMQHWHVYRKWNERLFEEMYAAYQMGRAEKDPSEFWYEGEMKFFDFYVIPLAKKLSDCGVFGVSSDEYLTYAVRNREEWERRGKEVVASVLGRITDKSVGGGGSSSSSKSSKSSKGSGTDASSTDSITSRTEDGHVLLPIASVDMKLLEKK